MKSKSNNVGTVIVAGAAALIKYTADIQSGVSIVDAATAAAVIFAVGLVVISLVLLKINR